MNPLSRILRYGTFVAALAGILAMTSVLRTLHGQSDGTIPPPPVTPAGKPFAHTVAGTGIIEALSENVAIGVPEAGLVTEVLVKVDDQVKRDTPLLKLDDRTLRAQLIGLEADVAVARAGVAVAQASREKAADSLSRFEAVKDPRAVSQDDLRTRRSDLAVMVAQQQAADSQVLAAEAKVAQTKALIERLTIKAPRDGTILQVNIRAGEYAALSPRSAALVLEIGRAHV